MNDWSTRTKKQNQLKAKTKAFKDNYKASQMRVKSGSSLHNLAGVLYSDSKSKIMTPKKQLPRCASAKTYRKQGESIKNPEANLFMPDSIIKSVMKMSGLTARVSHVPNFSQMNTQLLIQKRDLQRKIAFLKQSITTQNKKLYLADKNCNKNKNQLQKYTDLLNQNKKKSQNLQQQIDNTNKDRMKLTQINKDLNKNIANTRTNIDKQTKNCKDLEIHVKKLKISSLLEDKERIKVKGQLTDHQKVMKSSCKYYKELEDQRAYLLLQINKSVQSNQI